MKKYDKANLRVGSWTSNEMANFFPSFRLTSVQKKNMNL